MLTYRIIPCLDIRDNQVVKGVKFENLRAMGKPAHRAVEYQEQGADEIIILDVSATPSGRGTQLETVAEVREVLTIPLSVGGGIRKIADVEALLSVGADRVSINTAAILAPELIEQIASSFGRQCTVVAIDARKNSATSWEVLTHSGKNATDRDTIAWALEAEQRGAGEILLTSFDRDGTRRGYDLHLIQAVTEAITIPVIASGGAHQPSDFVDAIDAGASAVLAASIFHEQNYTVRDLKEQLAQTGKAVRLC